MTGFVATVGDLLARPSELRKAVSAGVQAFRLNLGRRRPEEHLSTARELRRIRPDVRLFVDLPGPGKARIVSLAGITLSADTKFALTARQGGAPVDIPCLLLGSAGFLWRLRGQDVIRVGSVECEVMDTWSWGVTCVSRGDGTIEFGKSVRMVSPYLSFGELDAGDVDLLDTVHLIEPDYLALSFAEQANAVRDLRERVAGWPVRVLAKIETTRGLINAEQLARAADGLMLGRDDLSLRVSASGLSEAAEELARLARQHGKEFVAASGYFSSVAAGCECSETDLRELRAVARYADWVVSDETAFAELPLEVINLARSTGLLGEGGPR